MYDLSNLRYCGCGAAPLAVEVYKEFERKYKACILIHMRIRDQIKTKENINNKINLTYQRYAGGIRTECRDMRQFDKSTKCSYHRVDRYSSLLSSFPCSHPPSSIIDLRRSQGLPFDNRGSIVEI